MPEPNGNANLPEHQPADNESVKDSPQTPFKPLLIDLTPEYEGLNIGYVGGARMPKKKS